MKTIRVGNIEIGEKKPLCVIAGPCVIESEKQVMDIAKSLKEISERLRLPLIFKSSYDKANRSAYNSFRGPGLHEGLRILEKVRKEFSLPITSDVHTKEEAEYAKEVLDLVQIPAFLCRQTDLLFAASGKKAAVSVKKGQFLSPWEMKNVVKKIEEGGTKDILLIERGTSFGYNNLIVDMRGFEIMKETGYPVCFDATHSVQLPGTRDSGTGGDRRFIPLLLRAAVAAGVSALFLECHETPEKALSDKETQVPLDDVEPLLRSMKRLHEFVNESLYT
jgi:2-dehydro-3-deoxyphosphooctonate aldolase (KDO 8-P synthase)